MAGSYPQATLNQSLQNHHLSVLLCWMNQPDGSLRLPRRAERLSARSLAGLAWHLFPPGLLWRCLPLFRPDRRGPGLTVSVPNRRAESDGNLSRKNHPYGCRAGLSVLWLRLRRRPYSLFPTALSG